MHQRLLKCYDSEVLDLSFEPYLKFFNVYYDSLIQADCPNGLDLTTIMLKHKLPEQCEYKIVAKSDGVFAGKNEIEYVGEKYGFQVDCKLNIGSYFCSGDLLFTISGKTSVMLMHERHILNILQRMCGIASFASTFKTKFTKVAMTRKTPLSLMDKVAGRAGGALPHRLSLSDAMIVKDTHFDLIGRDFSSLYSAFNSLESLSAKPNFFEVELKNLSELNDFISVFRSWSSAIQLIVMLDNFNPADALISAKIINNAFTVNKPIIEVSGGINQSNYFEYDVEGIDVMSIGAITHSFKSVDLSMRFNL